MEDQDTYRLVAGQGATAQLSLGLAVRLDPPGPLGALRPGDRFLQETAGIEGRLEGHGTGSASVWLWRPGERPTKTTWSLETEVRRLRG